MSSAVDPPGPFESAPLEEVLVPDAPDGIDDMGRDAVPVYVAVRTAAVMHPDPVQAVIEVLVSTCFVGAALDGAAIGAPGWIVASTLGFGDGTVVRWTAAEADPDMAFATEREIAGEDGSEAELSWDEVRSALEGRFGPEVQIGRYLIVEQGRFPALPVTAQGAWVPRAGVVDEPEILVGRLPLDVAPMIVRALKAPLCIAQVDGVTLVQAYSPGQDLWAVATWSSKTPSLLLWRSGSWTGFTVFRKSKPVDDHAWGPRWRPIDPSGRRLGDEPDEMVHAVVSALVPARSNGRYLAEQFRLEPHRCQDLQGLLGADDPVAAIPRLLALLGLPAVAGDVLAGSRAVADLPDARLERPVSLFRALGRTFYADPERSVTASTPGRFSKQSGRRWWEWPTWWVRSKVRRILVLPVLVLTAWLFFSQGAPLRGWFAVATGIIALALACLPQGKVERPR